MQKSEATSKQFSTKAFFGWLCAAPAITVAGAMTVEFGNFGDGIGYALPLFGLIAINVLFFTALATGLWTRTLLASLLGASAGFVLTVMVLASLI